MQVGEDKKVQEVQVEQEEQEEQVEQEEQEEHAEGQVEKRPNSEDDVINVVAEKDSNELELFLDIDPSVHCTRLRVRVPLQQDTQGNSGPLTVSANYTSLAATRRQSSITDFFQGLGSKEDTDSLTESAFEEVLQCARKKGFVAPDLKIMEKENKRRGREGRAGRCPWYKVMPDTSLAVDAFNYGAVPCITYCLLSHFHYDHYVGLSRT